MRALEWLGGPWLDNDAQAGSLHRWMAADDLVQDRTNSPRSEVLSVRVDEIDEGRLSHRLASHRPGRGCSGGRAWRMLSDLATDR